MGQISDLGAILAARLDRLSQRQPLLFSLCCAQRLAAIYVAHTEETVTGSPVGFVAILNRLWEDVKGTPMTEAQVDALLNLWEDFWPEEFEGDPIRNRCAQEAVSALAYTLEVRKNGSNENALYAARAGGEAAYTRAQSIDPTDAIGPEVARYVESNPVTRAETMFQEEDLAAIEAHGDEGDMGSLAEELRQRAIRNSLIF